MTASQAAPAWGADSLWRELEPLLPGLSVEVVRRCESTNSELLARARSAGGRRSGDRQPSLLVAEHQSAGRGRQGREWRAEPLASLTFSLSLPLACDDWSGLSLAVGVALADVLDPPPSAPRIGLKWPNDLWLWTGPGRGRKLGGILIETVTAGSERMVVIGVGLNILPLPAQGLEHGLASVSELDAGLAPPQVLARLALPLAQALRRFEREGFAAFGARFERRDLLRGQPVRAGDGSTGVADGVDSQGALRLIGAAQNRVVSGEVSIRLATGDAPC